MSVGKYSPTVSGWYARNQNWHSLHRDEGNWIDRDGYDIYGYHFETGKDRAGYSEDEYLLSGEYDEDDNYVYPLYTDIWSSWYSRSFPVSP